MTMVNTNAAEIYRQSFREGLTPDPDMTVTAWADEYRFLPRESSIEPGRYRSDRTPYVREIMDELSPSSGTEEVVFIKPTQIGATEIGNNFLMAVADLYPGPCLFVLPTDHMAIKHSKKKVSPSLRLMPCLQEKISPPKSRDSGNTILVKEFPGGSWTFTGSNSPAAARSDSIRYLVLDDFDGFTADAGEGDIGSLFEKRTDAFGSRKKIYKNSTPTVKGASNIEREYEESSQGRFEVPCPHCGKYQYLQWGGKGAKYGIKFEHDDDGEISDIWYECEHCHGRINEHHKTGMLARGKYVHKFPGRKKRGFKINALYSPLGWLSWEKIAWEFLKIGNDPLRLQVWLNTRMAETFEAVGDQPKWTILKARAEPYEPLTVPAGGLMLTAGVDVQENRLALKIKAWGRGEESWLIWWGEIYGDPLQDAVWEELDGFLYRQYPHKSGNDLSIISMAVDSGGRTTTHAVYQYCRLRSPLVIAIKGQSRAGRPVIGRPTNQDVNWQGRKLPGGVQLWPVGADTAKSIIYARLKIERSVGSGSVPGYCHFPVGIEDEYYKQLTAEKLMTKYVDGFPKQKWVKTRERNEALDCEVYAYAAAVRAGLSRMDWDALEADLITMKNDKRSAGEQARRRSRPRPSVVKSQWMS